MIRIVVVAGFALALSLPASAIASAQRTFVASNGADSNACSIAAPCRSFAAAIAHANAGGEVIVLDSAGYGAVTITGPISIIAPAGVYAGISVFAGENGVTINAGATDTVILRGLSINNQGGDDGVYVNTAGTVQIESCIINGMVNGIWFVPSIATKLIVIDTTVRNSTASGLVALPGLGGLQSEVYVSRSVFARNGGAGILFLNVKKSAISETLVAKNGSDGIQISAAGPAGSRLDASIDRVQSVGNTDGLTASVNGGTVQLITVTVTNSTLSDNINNGAVAGDKAAILLGGCQIAGNDTGTFSTAAGLIGTLGTNLRAANFVNGPAADVPIAPF